jgi:diguanylate cyclase (GGDEF)-like protein
MFYFETPHSNIGEFFNIIDRQTGAYNKSYFLLRLWQELTRAKRNKYPLSLALIKMHLKPGVAGQSQFDQSEVLRRARVLADKYLREEDLFARFDEDVLAILIPDTPGEKAKPVLDKVMAELRAIAYDVQVEDEHLEIKSSAGVVAYNSHRTNREQLLKKAAKALQAAEGVPDGNVVLYTENNHTPRRRQRKSSAESEPS